ncbi:MAG: hypothetical protein M1820_008089 [Bogoriella megaspora]|nr:MAG: hypothetical protein M1820_008089 [Bogoriella megaspora]
MGGKAFTQRGPKGEPVVHIPRMLPSRYHQLRDYFLGVLEDHFDQVLILAEAPEKTDYGDIDFLVEQKFEDGLFAPQIAKIVHAKRFISNGDSLSFAVKLPSEQDDTSVPFAQLDIRICQQGTIRWQFFHDSYGDMWQILGLTIRSLGLTATDQGLHVRIVEIEAAGGGKETSRLFLTRDPNAAMNFMGLDASRFARGFETEAELFDWIGQGRLFSGYNCEKKNSNDNKRLGKRPQFERFVTEWVPNHRYIWADRVVPSRNQVLQEALDEFGLEQAHNEHLTGWRESRAEICVLEHIAKIIPLNPELEREKERLNRTMRGMKRWVTIDNTSGSSLCLRSKPQMETSRQISFSQTAREVGEDIILAWVEDHWQEVLDRERRREKDAKKERDAAKLSI